jgi:hypothetical protein
MTSDRTTCHHKNSVLFVFFLQVLKIMIPVDNPRDLGLIGIKKGQGKPDFCLRLPFYLVSRDGIACLAHKVDLLLLGSAPKIAK